MTQVICSFLMPKPTGTSLAAHSTWSSEFPSPCHSHYNGQGQLLSVAAAHASSKGTREQVCRMAAPWLADTGLTRHQHMRAEYRIGEEAHRLPTGARPSARRALPPPRQPCLHGRNFPSIQPRIAQAYMTANAVGIKDNGLTAHVASQPAVCRSSARSHATRHPCLVGHSVQSRPIEGSSRACTVLSV